MKEYEVIIGLEVHAELSTKTKIVAQFVLVCQECFQY